MYANLSSDACLPVALLQSARAEFLVRGFADANVGRIAAAAGMSKKTIYKYVASKEALLLAVMEAALVSPGLALGACNPEEAPTSRLKAFLRAFAELAFSDEGISSYRLVMSEGVRFPHIARIYIETINRYVVQMLAAELTAYGAAGKIEVTDATRSARMLLAMVVAEPMRDAALGLEPPPGDRDLDALLEDAVATFLDGVSRSA